MAFVLTTTDFLPLPVPQKGAGEPVSYPTPRVCVGTWCKSEDEFAAESDLLPYLSIPEPVRTGTVCYSVADCFSPLWTVVVPLLPVLSQRGDGVCSSALL